MGEVKRLLAEHDQVRVRSLSLPRAPYAFRIPGVSAGTDTGTNKTVAGASIFGAILLQGFCLLIVHITRLTKPTE